MDYIHDQEALTLLGLGELADFRRLDLINGEHNITDLDGIANIVELLGRFSG